MIPALVLAGAPNTGRLQSASPAAHEALIDLHGRPLTAYVIDALLAAPLVDRVVVVGPQALKEEYGMDRVLVLEPAGGMLENLAVGLEALSGFSRVLVVTGDIPLLTAEIVEGFIRLCGDAEVEVYYPIIPREAVETRYPGVQRTYVRLREGSFTGGNVGLVNPRMLKRSLERAGDFVRLRKKPFRLALVVGPGFLCRFLLGRLSVENVERRVCRLLGFSGRAVIADLPEIGVDVDKPADLAAVKAILRK